MCAILDANLWSEFFDKKETMQPVHTWLKKKNGKLVYSDHQLFQRELTRKQKLFLKKYSKLSKAEFVPKKEVEKIIGKLRKNKTIKSNDIHILGLAKANKVKVLCTRDKKLEKDFKRILGGSIYKNQNHKHLLKKDTCP